MYLRDLGRFEEAIRQAKRAQVLDPLRADLIFRLGVEYTFTRQHDEALTQFRKTIELDPNLPAVHYWLAAAYESKKMYQEAAPEVVKWLDLEGEKELKEAFQGAYRAKGYSAARKALDQKSLEKLRQEASPDPWTVAFTYARLGQKEEAFNWLQKAYETRDAGLVQLKVDPDLDNLRSDPRFTDLLRRMQFPP